MDGEDLDRLAAADAVLMLCHQPSLSTGACALRAFPLTRATSTGGWLTATTVVLLAGGSALAQTTPASAVQEEDAWSFSLSAYTYVLPDSHYVQPNVSADRGWLHLEARWNYEDLHTGSVWFGYGFSGGKTLEWELTPMIGGVFGDTSGIAPGFKGSLRWRKLELSSENEYVADAGNRSDSFFYNWSELTLAPVERFWFGLVTQRTRVYESDRDIERGVVAGVSFGRVDLTGYVFDPDESRPWFVFAVEVTF